MGSHALIFSRRLRDRTGAVIVSLVLLVSAVLGPSPASAGSAQYVYDAAGRLTGVIDVSGGSGSAQYSYDADGNVLAVTNSAMSALVVLGFTPNNGVAGTTVTLTGTGFGTTANTSVQFNGTTATPSAVSATSITVAVPVGATTGKIAVTVGSVGPISTAASFIVNPVMTVSGFSPSTTNIGASLAISGSNFDPNPANDKVFIGGELALVTSASPTLLVVTVPQTTSGSVVVETPNGSATCPSNLTL